MIVNNNNIIYFVTTVILLCFGNGNAQTNAYNDGLDITVLAGQEVYLSNMGFTNQTNGTSGSLDNDGDIYIEGAWNNNAVAGVVSVNLDAVGSVNFTGTTAQALGGTRTTTFENLSINNTSATGITLDEIVTVNNSLTLTDGVVFTNAINLLVVVDGATSSQGSGISYVDGPMKKIGNDNNFIFPIGDNGVWARLQMRAMNNFDNTTEMRAEYVRSPAPNYSSVDVGIKKVSAVEHWDLERVFDPGNNNRLHVRLHWEDEVSSGITDMGDLTVARYSSSTSLWEERNAVGTDNGSDGYITTVGVGEISDFTDFTFGSKNGINPLPIELIRFDAKLSNDQVILSWETATELNNDYFVIERSRDGANFDAVTKVEGAGNSWTNIQYSARDVLPLTGLSYYRLKQVDYDGTFSYSGIKPIENHNESIFSSLTIFPNPSNGSIALNFDPGPEHYLTIVNVSGETVKVIKGSELRDLKFQNIDVSNLSQGYYHLNLFDGSSNVIQHAPFVLNSK